MTAPSAPASDSLASPDEAIERRLLDARRAGHPKYVWDDVPMSEWAAGVRVIEDVVAAALASPPASSAARPAVLRPSGEATQRSLAVAAFTTGTGPLLGHWIARGAVEAPSKLASALASHLAHARIRAERVRGHLAALAPELVRLGIRAVVLKGTHTAWRHFPEPGTRPASDVDVFVPVNRGREVEALLAGAGYRLLRRQRRPARSVWLPPGESELLRSLEVTHAWNPLTLDLHLSLGRDLYGVRRIRVPDPAEADLEEIPGLPTPWVGLRGPGLLVNLSLHASEDLYNLQLLRLVELVIVSRAAADPAALWGEALELAREWRALGDVFPAVALAHRLDALAVPEEAVAATRAEAAPALRALVGSLSPGTAQRLDGVTLSDRIAGARTPAEKLRRIAHMLFPDSTGGSWSGFLGLYVARAYQLIRGRVRIGSWRRRRTPEG